MEHIQKLREEGKTFKEIANEYDCHRSTVNRRYNRWLNKQKENESWFDNLLSKINDFFWNVFNISDDKWE